MLCKVARTKFSPIGMHSEYLGSSETERRDRPQSASSQAVQCLASSLPPAQPRVALQAPPIGNANPRRSLTKSNAFRRKSVHGKGIRSNKSRAATIVAPFLQNGAFRTPSHPLSWVSYSAWLRGVWQTAQCAAAALPSLSSRPAAKHCSSA